MNGRGPEGAPEAATGPDFRRALAASVHDLLDFLGVAVAESGWEAGPRAAPFAGSRACRLDLRSRGMVFEFTIAVEDALLRRMCANFMAVGEGELGDALLADMIREAASRVVGHLAEERFPGAAMSIPALLDAPPREKDLAGWSAFGAATPAGGLVVFARGRAGEGRAARPGFRSLSVLYVEDNVLNQMVAVRMLESYGHHCDIAPDGPAGARMAARGGYDLVIMDLRLPGLGGLEAARAIRRSGGPGREVPIVALTAEGGEEVRRSALEAGMGGLLEKPLRRARLEELLALHGGYLPEPPPEGVERGGRSPEEDAVARRFQGIVFDDDRIGEILDRIRVVAAQDMPVLILGESGTGKSLIASAIHHSENNPRRDKPFFTINCCAVADSLLESELFGHVKGAFTGAVSSKHGLFESAEGGTVFLDEIGDSSLAMQTKLLRVLEKGEYIRLGETSVRRLDVRLVTATNQDLERLVGEGRFRLDLYHRIRGVQIRIPPLRERKKDIDMLVRHFLGRFNREFGRSVRLSGEVQELLRNHDWFGNVRELQHAVQSMVLLCREETVTLAGMPREVLSGRAGAAPGPKAGERFQAFAEAKAAAVEAFERAYFLKLLAACDGNVSAAARKARMSRRYLTARMELYGLGSHKDVSHGSHG